MMAHTFCAVRHNIDKRGETMAELKSELLAAQFAGAADLNGARFCARDRRWRYAFSTG